MSFEEALEAIEAVERAFAAGPVRLSDYGVFWTDASRPYLVGIPQGWRAYPAAAAAFARTWDEYATRRPDETWDAYATRMRSEQP